MKTKKRKKAGRMRGSHTHGRGFKKKARGSGNRGGVGMSGTGKRGDQKKTLILKKYGKKYFGKDKALRRGVLRKKLKVINLSDISANLKKGETELNFKGYKILSEGEVSKKLIIRASSASKAAMDKVKSSGGNIIIDNNGIKSDNPEPSGS